MATWSATVRTVVMSWVMVIGGRAHLGDELADEVVDDAGHDRVEAGGRLVEEDHRRVGGDGAGEADALLHAAGELGRVEVGGLGAEADAGELVDREVAGGAAAERRRGGRGSGGRRRSARPSGCRRAPPPGRACRSGGGRRAGRSRASGRAVDEDCARVGGEDAEDALQRHRLAGARAADDDEALAGHDLRARRRRGPACRRRPCGRRGARSRRRSSSRHQKKASVSR